MKKIIFTYLLSGFSAFAFGQSITIDPQTTAPASLVVKGDLALQKITRISASGGNNAVDRNDASIVIFDNGGTIGGITEGFDGLLLYILGGGNSALIIKNNFSSASSANRILTHTGLDYEISNGIGGVLLIYDANALGIGVGRWRVIETISNSQGWSLTGNAGTTSANFLGTTDAQPLIMRTNNNEIMRISPTGSVGIGTTNPQALLHLSKGASGVTPASGTSAIFEDNTSHTVALHAPETSNISLDFGKPSNAKQATVKLQTDNSFVIQNETQNVLFHTSTGSVHIGDMTSNQSIKLQQAVALKESEFNGLNNAVNTLLYTGNALWSAMRNNTVIFLKSLPINCQIRGIPAPSDLRDGTILYLVFDDADCVLVDNSSTETDPNSRIFTGAGGNLAVTGNGGVTLVWANNKWRVIGNKE